MKANFTVLLLCGLVGLSGCESSDGGASARRITTRQELIGGPSALGEVGDFLLENNRLRFIVQDKGFSRGFGIYGGGLIDVDRVRAVDEPTPGQGNGRDQFGELFPIAFLQALEPSEIVVENDGKDGQSARVRVSGEGNDLVTLSKVLNQVVLSSHELPEVMMRPEDLNVLNPDFLNGAPILRHEIIYELKPNARHIDIHVKLVNTGDAPINIPSKNSEPALPIFGISKEDFNAPLGMVALFGAGNDIFIPGSGYDVRYGLEDAYKKGASLPFPALPGLIAPGVITTNSSGVSYGLFPNLSDDVDGFVEKRYAWRVTQPGETDYKVGDWLSTAEFRVADARFPDDDFAVEKQNAYAETYGIEVDKDDILVPFVASAFTGMFSAQTPQTIEPGQTIGFDMIFVVGDGDVGSVMDVLNEVRNIDRGTISGEVLDELSLTALPGLSVVVFDENDRAVNQFFTDAHGRFSGSLPEGKYLLKIEREPVVSEGVEVEVKNGQKRFVRLQAPAIGRANVRVFDDVGRPLPAKVTVVGVSPADEVGGEAMRRQYQFDLRVGQHWRHGDMVPDDPERDSTRRFIESAQYTDDGVALVDLAPNTLWTLYISRGPEYEIETAQVRVKPGETKQVTARLTRVVDTSDYISADFHLHASPSLDSSLPIDERVRSVVGEGVELLVSTDHNYVTDYRPTLDALELQDWASSMVGLEMTTLESGHFNGFPLTPVVGAVTKGAFEWSRRPPDELFESIRELGELGPENTIIQINHPRDSILGYFEQYALDPLTAEVSPPLDCSTVTFFNLIDCAIATNGPAFKTMGEQMGTFVSTFSYDFDAIEVLNGSVIGSLHHKRMPDSIEGLELPDALRDNLPQQGQILCDDGEVAHPGALDDWFNLLNIGYRYIATGTSDSHGSTDHTGAARTYIYVGHDDPNRLTSSAIVDAFRSRQVSISSGPFIEMFVNDQPMGSEVDLEEDNATIDVRVRAPKWMDVDEVLLWVNGEIHSRQFIEMTNYEANVSFEVALEKDSWVVAETRGDASLFPIQAPVDQPPILLGDAINAFAGPLGFGEGGLGDLAETRMGPMLPYAFTNPIWLNIGGDDFVPPGPLNRACVGYGVADQMQSTYRNEEKNARSPSILRHTFGLPKVRGDILDVRTVFDQFGRHQH